MNRQPKSPIRKFAEGAAIMGALAFGSGDAHAGDADSGVRQDSKPKVTLDFRADPSVGKLSPAAHPSGTPIERTVTTPSNEKASEMLTAEETKALIEKLSPIVIKCATKDGRDIQSIDIFTIINGATKRPVVEVRRNSDDLWKTIIEQEYRKWATQTTYSIDNDPRTTLNEEVATFKPKIGI